MGKNLHKDLTDEELVLLFIHILKSDRAKWYGIFKEGRRDIDIVEDFINGKEIVLIDFFEASEEVITKTKLRDGYKRILEIDASERTPEEISIKAFDISTMPIESFADIVLQFAILGGANYTTAYTNSKSNSNT